MSVAALNSDFALAYTSSGGGGTAANVAALDGTTYSVQMNGALTVRFTGIFRRGMTDCSVALAAIGLEDGTCANEGPSDSTPTGLLSAISSFAGRVLVDDTISQFDTNGGRSSAGNSVDWINLENNRRTWGQDGTGYGDVTVQSACTGSEDCRIWDWTLLTSDTAIRDVVPLPTGDDVRTHVWSVSGASSQMDCDEFTPGGLFNGTTMECETTYLISAMEIVGDEIGNENGLCESNETCIYGPNIGYYQGHGSLQMETFTAGTLTDITLMSYDTNGG